MNKELISRQQSAAMRGIAILAIILHNYCHWLPMVQENEYTFTQSNADHIWYKMLNPGIDIIAQLFSFFGHYGVPVFVFLSAYGLVMKYEKNEKHVSESAWEFIKKHYLKLFLMMVVGYAAFVMVDYMTPRPRHYEFWNVIGQLGMFSNLYADPDHVIWPGPYWYFGLMVQIYIVYRLILYKGKGSLGGLLSDKWNNILCVALALLCLAIQQTLGPESLEMQWYRYNVMGSLPVFCMGLLYARTSFLFNKTKNLPYKGKGVGGSKCVHAANVLLMTFLIASCSWSFNLWMGVPFIIVAATLSLVKCLPQFILNSLAWVGSISAAMFVCHPITRKVIIPISRGGELYAGLILYFVATIILAILFKHIIKIVSNN